MFERNSANRFFALLVMRKLRQSLHSFTMQFWGNNSAIFFVFGLLYEQEIMEFQCNYSNSEKQGTSHWEFSPHWKLGEKYKLINGKEPLINGRKKTMVVKVYAFYFQIWHQVGANIIFPLSWSNKQQFYPINVKHHIPDFPD